LDELGQMEYLLDAIPSPEDQLQIIQAIDQICQALASVSEKAQRAFVLHYFEGLTHKEIAEQIGVSTKMIQKYLATCLVQCYVLKQEKDLFV
jgi:RNA polymerase sigma-70 factor (ECF subfamily)